jgi:hypothetical protein
MQFEQPSAHLNDLPRQNNSFGSILALFVIKRTILLSFPNLPNNSSSYLSQSVIGLKQHQIPLQL